MSIGAVWPTILSPEPPGSRNEALANRTEAMIRVLIACLVLVIASCRPSAKSPEKPNILLVTIDTLRQDHVGSYGYHRDTTPNLDTWANTGTRFASAFSVSSWTLPAHATILTGLYPAEHGVQTAINALPDSAETLAEQLSSFGYETYAAVSHVYLTRRWAFDQGFLHFNDAAALGSPHRPVAENVVDTAIEWLRARSTDSENKKPFFMWLHIFDPHWDYSPPALWNEAFIGDYSGTMTGTYRSIAPFIKAVRGYDTPPHLSSADLVVRNGDFASNVCYDAPWPHRSSWLHTNVVNCNREVGLEACVPRTYDVPG